MDCRDPPVSCGLNPYHQLAQEFMQPSLQSSLPSVSPQCSALQQHIQTPVTIIMCKIAQDIHYDPQVLTVRIPGIQAFNGGYMI